MNTKSNNNIKSDKASKKAKGESERLPITPSVVKKLFSYTGNQCANPKCKQELVDAGGTMLGKIAHIHAAKNGARFDINMSDEQRREFSNLIVVCGICHDKIDDPDRQIEFTADILKKWKERHETRFQRAEAEFVDLYRDLTEIAQPIFPLTLKALATAVEDPSAVGCLDQIKGISEFIEKLRLLPLSTRDFAIKIARRMISRCKDRLPAEDVAQAFGITNNEINQLTDILDDHSLGDLYDNFGDGYLIRLHDRDCGGNPFIEMLVFCDKTGVEVNRLLYDLDFSLYDVVN